MKRYVTDANNTLSQDELGFTRNPDAELPFDYLPSRCGVSTYIGVRRCVHGGSGERVRPHAAELQDRFLLLCFGGAKDGDPAAGGNAYSLCRTHIQSCDFALSNYSYVRPFDSSLRSFTISRDRQLLLPFVKCGLAVNPQLQLFASPWSPPAFMKTNRRMNGGGKLRRSQYEAWAEVLAKYVDAYAREGVRISRMSVQNEPMASQVWDSCLFSAEEEAQFAAAYLRPALDASGHGDVKLFAWDHNTDKILSRVQSTFGAPVNQAGKLPLAAAGWRAEARSPPTLSRAWRSIGMRAIISSRWTKWRDAGRQGAAVHRRLRGIHTRRGSQGHAGTQGRAVCACRHRQLERRRCRIHRLESAAQ